MTNLTTCADAEAASWATPMFVTEFGCDQTLLTRDPYDLVTLHAWPPFLRGHAVSIVIIMSYLNSPACRGVHDTPASHT